MSDTETAPLLRVALGDMEQEVSATRRVLERIPGDRLAWRPHEKSWTLGELGLHLANLLNWQVGVLRMEEMDLAAVPARLAPPESASEILETFDRNAAGLRAALAEATDESLRQRWTLRHGDHVLMSRPRVELLRTVGISHMVHHRGQLGVYLRLLGAAVPGVYGPSADEEAGF